jgi:hypothetical protein
MTTSQNSGSGTLHAPTIHKIVKIRNRIIIIAPEVPIPTVKEINDIINKKK